MQNPAKQTPEFTIRWVLTHDPIALFAEAARRFAEIVELESEGRMQVKVFTPTEYGNGRRVSAAEVADKLAAGEIEMSQTYTTELGHRHNKLWLLDLPFLFRDHQHAANVLDSDLGMSLMDGLIPHGIRGLGYTYSGGYRIVSSVDEDLATKQDFSNCKVRVSDNPVADTFFRHLGAQPIASPLHKIPQLTEVGHIDSAESTWPRYWDMAHYQSQPHVMETKHSLFLTALLVNENFYQSLPEELKTILHSAALRTARLERHKSVIDGEKAKIEHVANGGTVHATNSSLAKKMESAAARVYQQYSDQLGKETIKAIQNTPSDYLDKMSPRIDKRLNDKNESESIGQVASTECWNLNS